MFSAAIESAKLFFAGKLFKDNSVAARQVAMASGAGALALVLIAQIAPLWLAGLTGGAVAGFLQPVLFKDIKYR